MLFPTGTFVAFFVVVFAASWALKRYPRVWKPFMLVAGYFFYAFWGWKYAPLLAGYTLVTWLLGRWLASASCRRGLLKNDASPSGDDRRAREENAGSAIAACADSSAICACRECATEDVLSRRPACSGGRGFVFQQPGRGWLLALAIVVDLLPLAFFKYYGFVAFNLAELFHWFGLGGSASLLQVAIPVGISFTTFRGVGYLVDVYRGKAERTSLLDFSLFMSFFPCLAAGPIARPSELLPQFKTRNSAREIDVTRALYLIALGLAKKVVIGDFLARSLVDGVFSAPGQYSSLNVVIGVHAYAVQIYCDFSGYTDMAIGVALLLGFVLPVNFNRPYTATSMRDFWRRWHITLSTWLRDYLYIPLGGSRRSTFATYRNVVITMVLAGLWHGAGWTFLVWGALHGAALAVEHYSADRRRRRGLGPAAPGALGLIVRRVATLEFVCLAWIFFRADSLAAAGRVIAATFTAWNQVPAVSWLVIVAIAAGLGLQYLPASLTERLQDFLSRRWPVVQGLVFGVVLFAIVGLFGAEGVSNFIYIGF